MNKVEKVIYVFLLIALSLTKARGQSNLRFTHLTMEEGLSQSSVISITQDADGFIWLGTMDGLNRFDGNRVRVFKSFYKDNPNGASLIMTRLLADKNHNVWVGTNNGLYLYNTRVDSFNVFFHRDDDHKSLAGNNIKALYQDKKGSTWIGTDMGLCRANLTGKNEVQFERVNLSTGKTDYVSDTVQTVFEDHLGIMWVGTTNGLTNIGNHSDKIYLLMSKLLTGIGVSSITEDTHHHLWIGTNLAGVYRVDYETGEISHFVFQGGKLSGLVSDVVRKVYIDRKGRVWIGTLKGLSVYDETRQAFTSYEYNPEDEHTLKYNSVYDIAEDLQGNIWVGTYFGGANIAENLTMEFKVYKYELNENSVSSNIISSIVEDSCKNLWIGTEAEGLNYFDRKKLRFTRYKNEANNLSSIRSNLVKIVIKDRNDNIWAGLNNGVLEKMSNDYKHIDHFTIGDAKAGSSPEDITAMMEDVNGTLWIGKSVKGLYLFNKKTLKAQKIGEVFPGLQLSDNRITCLFEDSRRNIWIGTRNGLNVLEVPDNSLKIFYQKEHRTELQSDFINCIVEDKKGIIWFGTYSGLSFYDPYKKIIKTFTRSDGLAADKVVGMVVDDGNNLWVSTSKGLTRIDTSRTIFNNYNKLDGLPGDVFNYNSYCKDHRGYLFFGGYNGFVEFNPAGIEVNHRVPKIMLTGLSVDGDNIRAGDSLGILKSDISTTSAIELAYNQNFLTITYAVLNYIRPGKNKSAYMLEGYDKKWISSGGHSASFTKLPPGHYTLFIKGCNNDGVWSKPAPYLTIIVRPPLWKTWWAYAMYVIVFLVVCLSVFHFFNSREELKRKLQYEHAINVREKELHQMKMDFFTHISHELRTPLTLIVGPAEMLLEQSFPANKTQKMLSAIKSNAERLLKLTNDLLLFRKADAGYLELNVQYKDLVSFCKSIFDKFISEALRKDIVYEFKSNNDKIIVCFDPEHMEIVFTNLLSNALKFTPKGGRVTMLLEKLTDEVKIEVHDTGIGIPAEDQGKIFTGFYQVKREDNRKNGSGIGLAFSKSLVALNKGTISFTSTPKSENEAQGTSFIVRLKLAEDHFVENNAIEN